MRCEWRMGTLQNTYVPPSCHSLRPACKGHPRCLAAWSCVPWRVDLRPAVSVISKERKNTHTAKDKQTWKTSNPRSDRPMITFPFSKCPSSPSMTVLTDLEYCTMPLTTDVTIRASTITMTSSAMRIPRQLRWLGLADTSYKTEMHNVWLVEVWVKYAQRRQRRHQCLINIRFRQMYVRFKLQRNSPPNLTSLFALLACFGRAN